MAMGLIAASAMKTAGAATAAKAMTGLAIGGGVFSGLQALGQAQYQSSINKFQAKQATIEGKVAYQNGRAKAISAMQQENIRNAEALVARYSKGTMVMGGTSGARAVEGVQRAGALNTRMAFDAAEMTRLGYEAKAASFRQRAKMAKQSRIGGIVRAGLGV